MLDSLLTLTGAAAAWLGGAFVLAVLASFGITAITGSQEPIFLMIAIGILAVLVVTSIYTAAKWVWHRLGGRRGDPTE